VAILSDPALLEGRELRFRNNPDRPAQSFSIAGRSAYLHGSKRIIDYVLEPESYLRSGTWWLLGQPAAQALRSGQAAIAPSHLPGSPSAKLGAALAVSAGLLGLSSKTVGRALSATGLSRAERTRLSELSDLDQRRAGLAHALLSDPQLLIMVQPLSGLNDAKRRELSRLIEQLIDGRLWMLGGEPGCSVSHHLGNRAHLTVSVALDEFQLSPSSPTARSRAQSGYFLHFGQTPHALLSELRERGATVTLSENPRVLLSEGLNPSQIEEACAVISGVTLLRLEPADEAAFRNSHARSAL